MKRKIIASLALLLWACTASASWTQLNYHDTLPLVSPVYPFDFLNSEVKSNYARDQMKEIDERIQISTNLFMQTTNYAHNQDGIQVPSGDVHGRLGLLALCYGATPVGQQKAALLTTIAGTAFSCGLTGTMNTEAFADSAEQFGFMSKAVEYRKAGVRMNTSVRLFENVVISLHGGACDMRQSMTALHDQTSFSAGGGSMGVLSAGLDEFVTDKNTLYNTLTRDWRKVLTQMGIDYSDWHEVGIEDATISVTYRGNIPVEQESKDRKWTKFLIVPHATLSFTGAFGNERNPDVFLSLPFGNNGHNAVSLSAGCAFAFNDTIEVFCEGSATQYMVKNRQMRVPTSIYQSGLFPYKTGVKVSPANSYQGTFGLNAHYFVDRLSGYVQVAYSAHERDTLELLKYDAAYKLSRLAADTEWKYGALNLGLNYDLSPNISLGGAAQVPMGRKGTYLTSTFMFGMTGTF